MTSYFWTGSESDAWDDPKNWSPNGIPGAGDTVDLNDAATVMTNGESVASCVGSETPTVLTGTGLTVTGNLESVILDGGSYQAGTFDGTLEVGQLTAGTVLGEVTGGSVTQSNRFGATLTDGSVTTDALISGAVVDDGTVTATVVNSLYQEGGQVSAKSVVLNPTNYLTNGDAVTIDGGAFSDTGTLSLTASTASPQPFFEVYGTGKATVSGAATIANPIGIIDVGTVPYSTTPAGGALALDGGVSLTGGRLIIGSGGALTVRGITSDNANITIQGVDSPQATFDGAVKIGETGNGSLSIVTGAVTVTSTGVALEVGSGTVSSLLGTLSVTGNTLIGDRGGQTGSFSVSSATLSGALTLGENGGIGNATISGGTLQVSGATILGQAAGDTGTLTATGAGTNVDLKETLTIGNAGAGTLTVGANAKVSAPNVTVGSGTGSNGAVNVSGASANLEVGGNLTLGVNGAGNLTVSQGGTVTVSGSVDAAVNTGSASTTTIGDPGATLTIDGDWQIGGAGAANAMVDGAVTVAVGGAIEVGADAGGNGTLTVSDTGTVLNGGAGDVTIGGQGTGAATVENGALFDAATSDVTVGEGQDSIGTLTVTGQGSEMEAGSLTVASASKLQVNNGQTTFTQATVAEGGALDVVSDLTIGETQGSNGRVTVTDAGSTLTVGGNADVGPAGKGLLAIDGAAVTVHGDLSLGEESGGSGKLTVAAGSVTCAGDITVGGAGSGSILVNLGGSITPGSLSIPNGATDTITLGESGGGKGTLTVDGALSSVTSFGLTVGEAGSGTFKATNGAVVDTTGGADVAEQAIGAASTVTVSGRSQWEVGGDLSIGAGGVGGATVSSAGLVDAKGDITLGEDKGASGTLTVTGVLNVTNVGKVASTVEWGGTLAVGESGFGTLSVASGAVVKPTSGGIGIVEIAAQAGSTGTVSVGGTGSQLSGTTLSVGGTALAAGGSGTLSIGAGSEASFAGTTVWNTGKIMDAGTLTLGGVVSGAGNLLIESGGTLKLERSDSAAKPVFVAGTESETLDLVANHLPAAHIVGFAANDFVFVSGLATSDTIETSYTATTAIVDFLQLGKTVGHLDFAETSGQHDVFQYNAATRALTLAPPT